MTNGDFCFCWSPLCPPKPLIMNAASHYTHLEFSCRGSMVILSCLPGEPILSASARTLVDCEYCETCDEARFFSVSCGLAHHTYTTAPGKTFMTDSHEWPAVALPASLGHTPCWHTNNNLTHGWLYPAITTATTTIRVNLNNQNYHFTHSSTWKNIIIVVMHQCVQNTNTEQK